MERIVSLMDMLDARERRAMRQTELLAMFHKPLISFTMNIAGPVKNGPDIAAGFRMGKQKIERELQAEGMKWVHFEEIRISTGNEAFYVVDGDAAALKRLMIDIEDRTFLGRLFDLDVIGSDGRKLERQDLGMAGRTCLLCNRPAKECARSRTHSVEELQRRTAEILCEVIDRENRQKGAELACRALLYEVATTPKPGLVDGCNTGSHKDMDMFTFIDSACALLPYFEACIRSGQETRSCSPADTFRKIRKEGREAEQIMFSATGGINTHKGAIFSIGIVCAAMGRLDRQNWQYPEKILTECAKITEGLTERDFSGLNMENAVTSGQRFYVQYGITGVRGQAEAGFPAVREYGLPVFLQGIREGRGINESGCAALLAIMASSVDTNLIARSNLETQQAVVVQVKALLEKNPYPDRSTLEELDRMFIQKNLSPGGSADLLAICYLLYFLMEHREESECHNM